MGTVVHRALPFLHEGSLEITRTVPLKSSKWPNICVKLGLEKNGLFLYSFICLFIICLFIYYPIILK